MEGGDHGRKKSVDRLGVDIVSQDEVAAVGNTVVEDVDTGLDVVGVGPVQGVNVGLDDVVAEASEGGQDLGVGGEVRGAHIGGNLVDDAPEGILKLGHLGLDVFDREGGKVGVGPAK